MATKSYLDLTKEELDAMTPQQRAWAALDYTYGRQVDKSNEDFAKAYSQAANAQISRGMQRSSYGAQTLANLQKQGVEAANDIRSQQSAAYANQLYQIERDEKADDQWQKQFDEGVRQFNEGQNLTRSENALNRAFQTSEREAQQNWQSGESALDRSANEAQWRAQLEEQIRQFNFENKLGEFAVAGGGGDGGGGSASSGGSSGKKTINTTNEVSDSALQGLFGNGKSLQERTTNLATLFNADGTPKTSNTSSTSRTSNTTTNVTKPASNSALNNARKSLVKKQ